MLVPRVDLLDVDRCAYFCLKYKRPLATTARPDDARTGSRRNCTALLVMLPMLHDEGGEGESDMMPFYCRRRSSGRDCGAGQEGYNGPDVPLTILTWIDQMDRRKSRFPRGDVSGDLAGAGDNPIRPISQPLGPHRPSWTR